MAYTYDDFVSAATGAGMMDSFTQEDLDRAKVNPEFGLSMVKLQQDVNSATTPEQKLLAQEAQSQLRKVYTGTAASGTGTPGTAQTGSSFTFDRQQELKDLTDKAVNMGSFTYDRDQDTSYAAARKQYLREAERARADTMAKAGAATGGTPSSFAVTAAQQAGDYHLTQLADREAALEQNAYQRYLNDYQKTLSDLDVLTAQRDFDYSAYLNQLQQDQQNFQNAMSLYETYKHTMSIEQLRSMFANLGYLTPGVESFLANMQAQQGTGGGEWYGAPPPEDGETALNKLPTLTSSEIASNAAKAVALQAYAIQQQQKRQNLMYAQKLTNDIRLR